VVSVLEHDEVHCGGLAVARFSITDAKTRFSELIQKAIAGEEVIIAKDNKPVVKVVPIVTPGRKRVPGSAKGACSPLRPSMRIVGSSLPIRFLASTV
jgi:prevent-host-death family protein